MKEYFKNDKHIFEANIKENIYEITIKIGGKSYNDISNLSDLSLQPTLCWRDCINISIHKGNPTQAKIPHLQAEPECSFDKILEDKESSNFIKASLQYVSKKYPDIKKFLLDDMSNVDCGKKRLNVLPKMRKLDKPFSLSHLYLATHGETWYEKIFGAKMINIKLYDLYKESRNKLHGKIDIDYDKFKHLYSIDDNNDKIISNYYSKDKTWIEFFKSIPRDDRCKGLYNWLPSFINEKIENTFIQNGWYIDIDSMPKTIMEIVEKPNNMKGGNQTIKSRIKITNKQYFYGNGHIFDGND